MNIGIAGAGAVGCHYGSLLQQAGNKVHYLARGAHLQAMQTHGLLHVSDGRQTRVQVHADSDPQILTAADVVLLSGKMTDFKTLLAALRPHIHPDALLVTLQNGVAAPDLAQQAFPKHAIAAGTAFIGARIEQPGMVVHSAAGGIRMGHWQRGPGDAFFAPLIQALHDASIPVREELDAALMLWRKLLWNIGFNALTAITRRYARDMAATAETLPLVRQSMQEAVAVAQAAGVDLTDADIAKHIEATLSMGPVKTSMWQDIDRQRPTEIDFLNGFIVERGAALGVDAPLNRMLTSLVHAIENRAHKPMQKEQ
ncbi:MAG: 2-dehydropantoate 2-reductase [Mariprofundaceae bacterium]